MDLYILNYNNYYNRTIKWEPDLNRYLGHAVYTLNDFNFNPNDNVSTVVTVGGPVVPYNGEGDYVLVVQNGNIQSRWFIMENTRNRSGQYNIVLRRDLVADFRTVMDAPMFIEKATVSNDDPAIFNKENMTFNQIKKSETLLKDNTECPWLAVYYVPPEDGTDLTVSVEENVPLIYEEYETITDWDYARFIQTPTRDIKRHGVYWWGWHPVPNAFEPRKYFQIKAVFNDSRGTLTSYNYGELNSDTLSYYTQNNRATQFTVKDIYWSMDSTQGSDFSNKVLKPYASNFVDMAKTVVPPSSRSDIDGVKAQQNKVIKADGKYYRVNLKQTVISGGPITDKTLYVPEENSAAFNYFEYGWDAFGDAIGTNFGTEDVEGIKAGAFVTEEEAVYTQIVLEEIPVQSLTVTIPVTGALVNRPQGSPYGIFCMPYSDNFYVIDRAQGAIYAQSNKLRSLSIVNAFIEKYGGGSSPIIYDAQVLPFCPCIEVLSDAAKGAYPNISRQLIVDTPKLVSGILTQDNVIADYLYHCSSTTIEFNLDYTIDVDDIKVSNECDMYRLISPNWNGQFEFSAAKNYGVSFFEVDMELKPYSPYIHVAPAFNPTGLYGSRINDPIGLICSGDFSLSQKSDAWNSYERQNKNYQVMFDRQIQNLETTQEVQRAQEMIGIAMGTLTGATSGAFAGNMIGGPQGAVAGGLIGAAASIGGGLADLAMSDKLREEALDFTKDQFTASLGNIKALPDSLTKVSSLNANNRLHVILEYYTCTDVEKQALRNKLRYNGMTVNRIDIMNNFIQTEPSFMKGKLIRFEDFPDGEDYHILSCLADELYKGVYI